MITIRRAVYEDIPDIMRFMDEHWKPGNILATNREFFEWQFLDGDQLNMFLGVDEECGKIYGIIGAIVYNRTARPDISGCTWQVIKSNNPRLGLDLADYRDNVLCPRHNCGSALSDKAVKIQKMLGYEIGTMDHYYRLAERESYKIAKIECKIIPEIRKTGFSLELISAVDDMKQVISEEKLAKQLLSKDYHYIAKRYFMHPIYHYDIWKIIDTEGDSHSILITREESLEDSKVCKIIDFYGREDDLGEIAFALDELMAKKNYEYVDVYSYGVPVEIYENGGFCRCDGDCVNIIPNYFHPFVRENIELRLVDTPLAGLRIFRGDGDQDRPC